MSNGNLIMSNGKCQMGMSNGNVIWECQMGKMSNGIFPFKHTSQIINIFSIKIR